MGSEPLRLGLGQDPERRTQLDVHLGLDEAFRGGADRMSRSRLRWPARRGHHAIPLGARRVRAARGAPSTSSSTVLHRRLARRRMTEAVVRCSSVLTSGATCLLDCEQKPQSSGHAPSFASLEHVAARRGAGPSARAARETAASSSASNSSAGSVEHCARVVARDQLACEGVVGERRPQIMGADATTGREIVAFGERRSKAGSDSDLRRDPVISG